MAHDPARPQAAADPDSTESRAPAAEDSTAIHHGPSGSLLVAPPAARYQLGREIARGGMGVVYAARDSALNREVAVKVLREEAAANAHIARRFVEEAQIAGQLQHPGIPPIHDLGTLPDGRPFIALKLIKGQTLADLLDHDRPDPARLIHIFEQVCQTVAYAHSRKVIHRDLKPANIMVGAFAEVQVMDWGLAKVLTGDSQVRPTDPPAETGGLLTAIVTPRDPSDGTLAGSLLGTPAYMPPEQAKGQVDRLDARADVFALGAILCKVLTGEPPYTGSAEEVRALALTAQLGPALARLEICGADPDLIDLARQCLSPNSAARPKDAGAVAAVVVAHRAQIQDRLRQAELAAARTEAEAVERRKRRRVQIAPGLAALALIGLLSIGGWWRVRQAADRVREQDATRTVARQNLAVALDRAATALKQENLPAAAAALDGATDLVEQAADPASMDRYNDLRADSVLVAELDRVWARANALQDERMPGTSRRGGWAWSDQEAARTGYPAAFAARGLTIPTANPADAAAGIAASPVRDRLVAALDDWLPFARPDDRAHLCNLLERVDADPTRDAIRRAHIEPDRLKTLLADAPPAAALRVAARAAAGPAVPGALALPVLRAAVVRYPEDFRILYAIAVRSLAADPAAAAGYFQTILILRPDSVIAAYGLGLALHTTEKPKEAAAHYLRAIELDPSFGTAYINLADTIKLGADRGPAVAHFERVIAKDPNQPMSFFGLGMALRDSRSVADLQRSATALREAVRLDESYALTHHYLGYVLHRLGKNDECVRCYQRALQLDPTLAFSHYNLGGVLRENDDLTAAIAEYRAALVHFPTHTFSLYDLSTALVEQKNFPEAIKTLRRLIEVAPKQTRGYSLLGQVLLETADRSGAVQIYRACCEQFPTWLGGYDGLVLALTQSGANVEAVRVYHEAVLRADAKWPAAARRQIRYNAACAAALAGSGFGTDAPPVLDRPPYRRFALDALGEELASLRAASQTVNGRQTAHDEAKHWLDDADLAAVRHPLSVAILPPTEREQWQRLWADVRKLRDATTPK